MIGEAAHYRSVCQRRSRVARVRRAFTFVEYLVVVLAIGILAMFVIPQFSRASQHSKQNTLKDSLQFLRTQIVVFKAQHQDVPPGYPRGDPVAAPSESAFVAQMTEHSDVMCRLSAADSVAFQYGPYLREVPANPMNGLSSIELVGNNMPLPAPDGKTGWIYKPQTQEIVANVTGKDGSGISYSDY